jgi:hypothetical protein
MDLETRVQAEALLLKAARTHGVQVRRDEVQQHLRHDHHGAALAEWASLHLTTDNLLSPDELAMYVWDTASMRRGGKTAADIATYDVDTLPWTGTARLTSWLISTTCLKYKVLPRMISSSPLTNSGDQRRA